MIGETKNMKKYDFDDVFIAYEKLIKVVKRNYGGHVVGAGFLKKGRIVPKSFELVVEYIADKGCASEYVCVGYGADKQGRDKDYDDLYKNVDKT